MSWSALKSHLKSLPSESLLDLLKGLYQLSPQNKAWLEAHLMPPDQQQSGYLEECRKKVIRLMYDPRRRYPDVPRFGEARKVISEYTKATGDALGALDLTLTCLERGHAFTNQFGDIDAPFYDALINVLYRFSDELQKLPDWRYLYRARFRQRLESLHHTSDIGWGYGYAVREVFEQLDQS